MDSITYMTMGGGDRERGYERRQHRKGEGVTGQQSDRIWEDSQERTEVRTGYEE